MILRTRDIIEQIESGNVPEGYKKTKVGIVPADWDVYMLGDCLSRVEKPVEVKPNKLYTQIGIRSHGKGLFYKEPVTGVALGNKAVFWIEPDCFIVNIVFAWEQAIGKTTQSEVGMIGSHRFPMYRPVNNRIDIDYLIFYFLTKRGTDILEAASPGGAGRNKTLGQDRFLKSKIVLPPIEEQQKIAAILTTQDKVIELKEKRLAEKQRQKKYLMQQLLTGKKRLPGFSGKWIRIRIGNSHYTKIDYDSLTNNTNKDFEFEYITLENVNNGFLKETIHCTFETAPSRARRVVHKDDILYGTVRPNLHSHLLAGELLEGMVCSTGFCVIQCNPSHLLPYFLYSAIFLEDIDRQAKRIMSGSNYPAISSSDVKNMKIDIPCNIKEQEAITSVLSVADREIDLLQQDIQQEKQKKKALMQLLLTGIVRVKT